jgi:hypothetical protein
VIAFTQLPIATKACFRTLASRRDARALSSPHPIQRSVLDRFADVVGGDGAAAVEVRDGAGDLQDSGVGARAQAQAVDRQLQQPLAGAVHLAQLRQFDR